VSQKEDAQALAEDLARGLKKLGPNRTVALSVHVTKDLIAELEIKAEKLVAQIKTMS
jgi:hypothetical protein